MISTLSQFRSLLLRPKEGVASCTNKNLGQSLIPRQIMVSCEEGMSVGLESGTAG